MPKTYHIKEDYHNARFDRWFKANILDLPQSLIEKLIRKKKVKINRKKAKTSYKVQLGDSFDEDDIVRYEDQYGRKN